MAGHVVTRERTARAAAATPQHARVVLNTSGQWAVADASTAADAVARNPALAAGEPLAGELLSSTGTFMMIASAAVTTPGDELFAAAGGKVAPTGTVHEGWSVGTASGDGAVIEVLRKGA